MRTQIEEKSNEADSSYTKPIHFDAEIRRFAFSLFPNFIGLSQNIAGFRSPNSSRFNKFLTLHSGALEVVPSQSPGYPTARSWSRPGNKSLASSYYSEAISSLKVCNCRPIRSKYAQRVSYLDVSVIKTNLGLVKKHPNCQVHGTHVNQDSRQIHPLVGKNYGSQTNQADQNSAEHNPVGVFGPDCLHVFHYSNTYVIREVSK